MVFDLLDLWGIKKYYRIYEVIKGWGDGDREGESPSWRYLGDLAVLG